MGIVIRAAKVISRTGDLCGTLIPLISGQSELRRCEGLKLPTFVTANALAAGDINATMSLVWALATAWYILRIPALTGCR